MMARLDHLLQILLAVLLAALAFEFQALPFMSSVQWVFLGVAAVSVPIIIRERQRLWGDRLVLAALVFVSIEWTSALLAPEFTSNAVKAAIRVTAGFIILCATLCVRHSDGLRRTWAISAILAAIYGLIDLAGYGFQDLFRDGNFYYANVTRLSGSFEYPTTAAAFFALSLPIIMTATGPLWLRIGGSVIVWSALILTYSRGAVFAVVVMFAIWSMRGRTRIVFPILILCAGILGVASWLNPTVARRFLGLESSYAFSVQYETDFNLLRRNPGQTESFTIRLRNNGTRPWVSIDGNPFWLRYRWYDPQTKTVVLEPNRYTPVATPIAPGGIIQVDAPLRTPSSPGLYVLTWDLFGREPGWFNNRGMYPAVVEVEVRADIEPWSGKGDVRRWYSRELSSVFINNDPFERLELWRTGFDMFSTRPLLGVGLDNFRLLRGRKYGLKDWDMTIRANNLYIELLAGSGILGLAAFLLMIGAVRWKLDAPSVALGIFLIHGVVDVFLMTTPAYFAFWF